MAFPLLGREPIEEHHMSKIKSFIRDESGAAAAEYALILAIVATGIAGAVTILGGAISTAISNAASYIAITPNP
jgi:pilus assembly protein Flp/PilA